MSRLARLFGSPPWVAAGLSAVWSAVVLVTHSDAGTDFATELVLLFAGAALLVWWIGRIVVAVLRRTSVRARPAAWILLPVLMVGSSLVAASGVPMRVRLALGADALLRNAKALETASGMLFQSPRRVGLYRVRSFERYGDELRFLTADCALLDTCGFVYSPAGPPPRRGEDTFEHVFGPWYHWHQSF